MLLNENEETHVFIDEINPNYTPQWWIRVGFKSILVREQSTEDINELKGLVLSVA